MEILAVKCKVIILHLPLPIHSERQKYAPDFHITLCVSVYMHLCVQGEKVPDGEWTTATIGKAFYFTAACLQMAGSCYNEKSAMLKN